LNADLLFGIGEIVGCGECHADGESVRSALADHNVPISEYEWYVRMKDEMPLRTGSSRLRVWVWFEAAGFEQWPGVVVGGVPGVGGGSVGVLERSVDCFCWGGGGVWVVGEREDVRGVFFECAAKVLRFDERGWDAGGGGVDHGVHCFVPELSVGFVVGGDHALIDAPGRFDLDMLGEWEQRFESRLLSVGE